MSENSSVAFEESWARQVRTTRLIMIGCLIGGAYVTWYGATQADGDFVDRLAVAGIGGLCVIFGLFGLVLLWRSIDTGLRIDTNGITVRLPLGPVSFKWNELSAVDFRVTKRVRPGGSSPKAVRTNTRIELRLAPVDQFAERRGLRRLRIGNSLPYTHRILVPSTGPFASSEERIVGIDAALRVAGGATYAGLERRS